MKCELRSMKSPPVFRNIDPSLSSLEEFGSFEDFMAFYIRNDNADPTILYLDQKLAKYLHLSCIFLPVMALVHFSDLFTFSPFFAPYKTILILCDKHMLVNFSGYCCVIWQATDQ